MHLDHLLPITYLEGHHVKAVESRGGIFGRRFNLTDSSKDWKSGGDLVRLYPNPWPLSPRQKMSRFPLDSPEIAAFMASASKYLGQDLPKPKDVFDFGEDKPHVSDELLSLAIEGKKTATTSWPVPSPRHWDVGDLSVILDGAGKPSALMRTTELKTCKFRDVEEDFGLAEAEGSFEQYRKNHFYWYGRYGEKNGEVFGEGSVVLCERFEVIYPPNQKGESM